MKVKVTTVAIELPNITLEQTDSEQSLPDILKLADLPAELVETVHRDLGFETDCLEKGEVFEQKINLTWLELCGGSRIDLLVGGLGLQLG